MKKYIKKTCLLFLWMILGLIIGTLVNSLAYQIYNLLYKWFPDTFPLYNIVFQKEKYLNFTYVMSIISMSVTLALTTYLCQRFNNDRFEFIITKTDGLYRLSGVLKTYVCIFASSDIVASIINGLVFTIPVYFIPAQFFSTGSVVIEFLELTRSITDALGPVGAPIYVTLTLILSHAITLPFVLKYYRAKWLTGFVEGTV